MKKLYDKNPYLASWETEVEKVEERNGKYHVVLSETAFYPEAGGQPSDRGTIDGIEVLDLVEEGEVIYHVLEIPPKNKTVKCSIDFESRFDLMQQHSGQHLLSSVFYKQYNGRTSGFHLGEDYVTIDISLTEISEDIVKKVEDTANNIIYKNVEIKTHVTTYDEAANFPLRKLPPKAESIRIVEIEGNDFSPCCGTHVRRTGEIGIIKIIKTEKYKGMTRIYFKCGRRALLDFQNKNEIILYATKQLSAPENEIMQKLDAKEAEIREMSLELKNLKDKLSAYEAAELVNSSDGNLISKVFEDKSFDEIQRISKQILKSGNYITVISSIPDRRTFLSHDGGFSINCGSLLKENLLQFSGRGGGGDNQAQASFKENEDQIKFHEFITKTIKARL